MLIKCQEHSDLLEKIARNNGYEEYEITEESGAGKGDGYLSTIVKVTIKNNTKTLNLIFKLAPTNEKFRNSLPVRDVFKREIWIYETGFVQMKSFQELNGLRHGFEGYARCYGTCDKENREAIVMEDLLENGYRRWNRKIPMDTNHIALVMSEYGKFHAVSFAMRKKNPELFQEFQKFVDSPSTEKDEEKKRLKIYLNNAKNKLSKAIKGYEKLEEALHKIMEDAEEFFLEGIEAEKNRIILGHGDAWCNNMLFKYETSETTTPSKVCLIDWQLAGSRHPVYDLSFFFFSSAPREILHDYEIYLKIYHDNLSTSLQSMSCNPEEIYPYSLLQEQWKKFGKVALFIAPMVFSALAVEEENIANLVESINSISEFFEEISNSGDNAIVDSRIRDLMLFMLETKMI